MTHSELRSRVEALEKAYAPSHMAALRDLGGRQREDAGLG
jgi:hypothetical protein